MAFLTSHFSLEGLPLVPAAKILGITSSAMLAGVSAASAIIVVPTLKEANHDETALSQQWRRVQQLDFYVAAPHGVIAGLTWTWLALTSPRSTAIRWLYAVAAVIVPAAVPFSIIVQRRLQTSVETPPSSVARTRHVTLFATSVESWARHNGARAVVAAVGGALGAWAAFNETFLSGVQVGASAMVGEMIRQQALQSQN